MTTTAICLFLVLIIRCLIIIVYGIKTKKLDLSNEPKTIVILGALVISLVHSIIGFIFLFPFIVGIKTLIDLL